MSLSPSQPGRHMLDGTVRVFAAEALRQPTGLLTAAFLTRRLGPEGYGLFTLAASLTAWIEGGITTMFARAAFNAPSDNPYASTSQLIVDMVYAYYNADSNRARFFASNNHAVPAERFRALGGFDATFRTSEDRDLCDRWLHHGYRVTYAPEAIVYHAHALTLRTFWRQHFNYGRGALRFHWARVRRGAGRFRPDLKFYRQPLRYPLSQRPGPRALLLAVLLVGQGANAAGFLCEGLRHTAGLRCLFVGRQHLA